MIMAFKEERILTDYLRKKGLRQGRQRLSILQAFLSTEKHLTPEELCDLVRKKTPGTGIATVYRTLKLLSECGLAREVVFEGGRVRYEHLFGHDHHDHLVCTRCKTILEVVDPEIERLQVLLARRNHFKAESHRMQIYGICEKCAK